MAKQSALFNWDEDMKILEQTDRESKEQRKKRKQLVSYQLSKLFPVEEVELMIETMLR